MNLPEQVKNKIQDIRDVLDKEVVDIKTLRRLVNKGVPDEAPQLRKIAWKLLLKYLPSEKGLWSQVKQNYKKTYQTLVDKFMGEGQYLDYPIALTKVHPEYETREKDFELWEQIEKDVIRTRASISFFSQKTTSKIVIPYLTQSRKEKFKQVHNTSFETLDKSSLRENYIHDHMSRILYIYSKLNPTISYVQGMNQILAPIFFTLNNHRPLNDIDQEGCFFLLNSLMTQVIDLHMVDMDKSSDGIYGRVNLINQTLQLIQPILWLQLKNKGIDPVCYNFKWLVLLFAQEFEIFDVCRLWDSLLTYKNVKSYLVCVSLGILQSKGKEIQEGDSMEVLKALQELREENIEEVIQNAEEVYRILGKKDLEKLVMENKENMSK